MMVRRISRPRSSCRRTHEHTRGEVYAVSEAAVKHRRSEECDVMLYGGSTSTAVGCTVYEAALRGEG